MRLIVGVQFDVVDLQPAFGQHIDTHTPTHTHQRQSDVLISLQEHNVDIFTVCSLSVNKRDVRAPTESIFRVTAVTVTIVSMATFRE